METMSGVVSGMSTDGKRIKIDEEWYSVFAVASMNGAQVGDEVKFAYIQKESGGKVYNNIRGTVTVKKGSGTPTPSGGGAPARGGYQESPERNMSIIRQNALTNAVNYFNNQNVPRGENAESDIIDIITIAEAFVKFSSGEYERNKEAMEAVEAETKGRALDKVARSVLVSTHAIIDGDTIVYAVGLAHDKATENNGGVEEPIANLFGGVKMTIESLLGAVGADSYELFLTGGSNFRNDIFPLYKANRVGVKQPERKHEIREYLTKYKGAIVIDGMEADDACGIAMYSMPASKTVLIHQDKDLNMLRGNHYNWHKCHRDAGIYNVSEDEADRIFYRQLLKGDSVDNIRDFSA